MLGACRGLDASIFYPDNDDDAAIATQVCQECGVRRACLEFALTQREKTGVWGGATERERRRILRQRRRTA
jgi:WhiB family redox-sensing transcriptional regulator